MSGSAALMAGLVSGVGDVYLKHVKQEHDDKIAMLQKDLQYHIDAINSGNLDDEGMKTAQRHIGDIFTNFGKGGKKGKGSVNPADLAGVIQQVHGHLSPHIDAMEAGTVDPRETGSDAAAAGAATVPGTLPASGSPVPAPPGMAIGGGPQDSLDLSGSSTSPAATATAMPQAASTAAAPVTPIQSAPAPKTSPVSAPPAAPSSIKGYGGLTYKTTRQKMQDAADLEGMRTTARAKAALQSKQDAVDNVIDTEAEAAGMSSADYKAAHPDRVQQLTNTIVGAKPAGTIRAAKDSLAGSQIPANVEKDADGDPIDRSGKMMYRELQQNGKFVGWQKAGSPKYVGRENRVQSFMKDALAANPSLDPKQAELIARQKVQREDNALMASRAASTLKNQELAKKVEQEISQGNLSPNGAKAVYNVVSRDVEKAITSDPKYIMMKASDRLQAKDDLIDQQLVNEGWDPNQVRKVMGGDRGAATGGAGTSTGTKKTKPASGSGGAAPPATWEELKKRMLHPQTAQPSGD